MNHPYTHVQKPFPFEKRIVRKEDGTGHEILPEQALSQRDSGYRAIRSSLPAGMEGGPMADNITSLLSQPFDPVTAELSLLRQLQDNLDNSSSHLNTSMRSTGTHQSDLDGSSHHSRSQLVDQALTSAAEAQVEAELADAVKKEQMTEPTESTSTQVSSDITFDTQVNLPDTKLPAVPDTMKPKLQSPKLRYILPQSPTLRQPPRLQPSCQSPILQLLLLLQSRRNIIRTVRDDTVVTSRIFTST